MNASSAGRDAGAGRTRSARPAIARFDRWADAQLERLRGNPVADAVFTAATASATSA